MGQRNLTRGLLVAVLLVTVASFVIFAILGNQLLGAIGLGPGASGQTATPTPTIAPTPTPTPSPTPTPTPSPTPMPSPTPTNPLDRVQAQAYYLIDMDTGTPLTQKNATQQLPMGSTTKIMTAVVAMQNADPEQDVITVNQDAIDRVNEFGTQSASNAGLVVGDKLLLKDLLYGLLVQSGADAARAIADDIGGNVDNFVQMMNNEAQAIGLTQTHFTSPDGLSDQDGQHYTTATDLVTLANYALKNFPLFDTVVQTAHYDVNGALKHHAYHWDTYNLLILNNSYPGIFGVKTGYTDMSRYCFVFGAARDGHHRVLGALLTSPTMAQRDQDAMTLLDWGFTQV